MRKQKTSACLVAVVDDDRATYNVVRRIGGEFGLNVQAYSSCIDFVQQELQSNPNLHCLVINLRLTGDGADFSMLCEKIRDIPKICIAPSGVILRGLSTFPFLSDATGVRFLQYPYTIQQMREALQEGIESYARWALDRGDALRVSEGFSALTRRELDVCKLVASGMTNADVGQALGISIKTVKAHRGKVMSKTGASSLADLVRRFDGLQRSR
ncbi:MAG: LuxR C-terminal-related transcriptional regulator [Gallionella sp.]|nr:LuxR C-terminal-related transcriptional regulator [Gallionella sp.]